MNSCTIAGPYPDQNMGGGGRQYIFLNKHICDYFFFNLRISGGYGPELRAYYEATHK